MNQLIYIFSIMCALFLINIFFGIILFSWYKAVKHDIRENTIYMAKLISRLRRRR